MQVAMKRPFEERPTVPESESSEWISECLLWRKRVLVGKKAHFCPEWDGLPFDETCFDWPCGCQWSDEETTV